MVSVLEFVHENIPATLRQITNCLVFLYPEATEKLVESLDKMLGDLCWTGTLVAVLTNACSLTLTLSIWIVEQNTAYLNSRLTVPN